MFRMVDAVLSFEPNQSIVTKKLTSISEEVYESHFPYYPILPAVLLLENIKQSIALFYKKCRISMCKVEYCKKVKLYKPVLPGDLIITEVKKQEGKPTCDVYSAVIRNQDGEVVCRVYNIEVRLEGEFT